MTKGQCDGTADLPYPGSGTHRHCAFKDVRSLWQDGSYADGTKSPAWGWVGKGGDTYLIRGSIGTGVSYRIGWNVGSNSQDPSSGTFYGLAGDPYGSGMPAPPSGTPAQHTRILGENYASCHAGSARTQLHGGYGVQSIMNMSGASYVDVACLDLTDFSACGRAAQVHSCTTSGSSLSDYATNGITWSNRSTNDTLADVRVHGVAGAGMIGPTGDGMVFRYLDLIGNPSSGWNADAGDGTTGTGSLLVEHYNISWNGCAEEYPLVDPLPYNECTDDNGGGYGDGFGTTTKDSNPAWHVVFDQGTVSYNTQDGLDALHINGAGSSMTVSHTLAFGNMGQQIKVGGASGVITDDQIVTNCNALREKIPGTPAGFNTKLSDYCRAADAGVVVTVNDTVPLKFDSNTVYSASSTALEIECAETHCNSATKIDFRNNIFVGFKNDPAHGYTGGGRDEDANFIYIGTDSNPFTNAGSDVSGNVDFYPESGRKCPTEVAKFTCTDPHLLDETWHLYGHGNMAPGTGAQTPAKTGESAPGLPGHNTESAGHGPAGTHVVECVCAGVLAFAVWRGIRFRQDR